MTGTTQRIMAGTLVPAAVGRSGDDSIACRKPQCHADGIEALMMGLRKSRQHRHDLKDAVTRLRNAPRGAATLGSEPEYRARWNAPSRIATA